MKVLIVTHHCLDGNGGGVYASRAFINGLATLFGDKCKVSLLYPSGPHHSISGIIPQIEAIPVEDNRNKLIKSLLFAAGAYNRFKKTFNELLRKEHFDIIVFDNSKASQSLIHKAKKTKSRIITIHHNCEIEYTRDNTRSIFSRLILYRTKKTEYYAVKYSDLNLTLTIDDKEKLGGYIDHGVDNMEVIGVFESEDKKLPEINCSARKVADPSGSKKLTFVISGDLSAQQTEDSLFPWIDNYYPVLKEVFGEIELIIAGKNPNQKLREKCKVEGIHLVASPENMDDIIKKGDIYLCPTSKGGGLKLRIMDGLRFGLPVLAHEVSARGYEEFQRAGMMFIYNSPETFRNACKALLGTIDDLSKTEVQNKYRETFSFDSGVERLRRIVKHSLNLHETGIFINL